MKKLKQIVHKATETPRKRNISLTILAILFLLGGAGFYYWSIHKKSLIKSEIDKTLIKKTDGLYTLTYDLFELDEVAGSLLITECSLQYDSSILSSQQDNSQEPSTVFNLYIPKITVSGVQTPRALLEKEIAGNNIDIYQPTIELIYTGKGKDSSRTVPREELYRQLLGKMQSLQMNQVSIRDAHVFVRRLGNPDTLLTIEHFTIVLNKVLVDSASSTDSTRFLFAKELAGTAASVQWKTRNGDYAFQLDTISLSSSRRNLTVMEFQMKPILSEEAFMKKKGVQTDRLDLRFKELRLVNLNMKNLFNQLFVADSIIVGEGNLKVYKDMGLPRDGKNRVGTFPHQLIRKIPFDIDIRKGLIRNTYIEYKQLTPKTGAIGKIGFYQTTIAIDNITNVPALIARNPISRLDATSRFLNQTPLSAQFRLNLGAKNGAFSVSARIGGLSANSLTSIAEPLASARMEKGKIDGVEINIRGSDYSANAIVKMRYHDLKIAVMEKNKDDGSLDKKGFISAAANILVKNNNPGKDGKIRASKGFFERDTNRSFFNLIWKSTFVAVAETLGVNAKTSAEK